jgi:ligand-binding sensor domain-containing protein
MWVGTTGGLCRLVPDPKPERRVVADVFTTKEGLTDNWTNSLVQTSEGELIVGSRGFSKLIKSPNGQLTFRGFTTAQGLSDNSLQTMAEDRDGNLWLGSRNGGVMKIARNGFNTFSRADGLGENEIY